MPKPRSKSSKPNNKSHWEQDWEGYKITYHRSAPNSCEHPWSKYCGARSYRVTLNGFAVATYCTYHYKRFLVSLIRDDPPTEAEAEDEPSSGYDPVA